MNEKSRARTKPVVDARTILKHRFESTGDYIAQKLKARYSDNANDTGLHKFVMDRFYVVYSQSQDYYHSNKIGSIMSQGSFPSVVQYNDIQTMLDEDEYLKRFYSLHEYDNKIKLLSEYYKFHKDIPRLFLIPTSKTLNKYHDKKRKIEYYRIKKLLVDEAQKKNKKVAMNEDDNEIR